MEYLLPGLGASLTPTVARHYLHVGPYPTVCSSVSCAESSGTGVNTGGDVPSNANKSAKSYEKQKDHHQTYQSLQPSNHIIRQKVTLDQGSFREMKPLFG